MSLMDRVPADSLASEVLYGLTQFHDDRVLDWIEGHVREPIDYKWGTVAAVNCMSWGRVKDWLGRGRPLSLVALDAMKNCRGYDKTEMSGVFKNYSPKVAGRPKVAEVTTVLSAYARADPDKRVTDDIAVIAANLDKIF